MKIQGRLPSGDRDGLTALDEHRTGQVTLPIDLEDELRDVFESINLDTGEVTEPGDDDKEQDR